jgi:hypothetical protein
MGDVAQGRDALEGPGLQFATFDNFPPLWYYMGSFNNCTVSPPSSPLRFGSRVPAVRATLARNPA